MPILNAGPTIVTSQAKAAVKFYAKHFDLTANDYGAGDECWYWTLTFGENSEMSLMLPLGGWAESDGTGLFFYLEYGTEAEVDAMFERLTAAGVRVVSEQGDEITAPYRTGSMYQIWAVDPAGTRLMLLTTTE
ncbi:MAG: VOC family protein [Promicromonosporaceae bacterium]|nr:VOC family protein [Promicromonosporaceae bacterium]